MKARTFVCRFLYSGAEDPQLIF